jgi:hypothetical protein
VDALRVNDDNDDSSELAVFGDRRLAKVHIRVSNGNAVVDSLKCETLRQREGEPKINEDLAQMLDPFEDWRGVSDAKISGAVTPTLALRLVQKMKTEISMEERETLRITRCNAINAHLRPPQLCVYGNDMA